MNKNALRVCTYRTKYSSFKKCTHSYTYPLSQQKNKLALKLPYITQFNSRLKCTGPFSFDILLTSVEIKERDITVIPSSIGTDEGGDREGLK